MRPVPEAPDVHSRRGLQQVFDALLLSGVVLDLDHTREGGRVVGVLGRKRPFHHDFGSRALGPRCSLGERGEPGEARHPREHQELATPHQTVDSSLRWKRSAPSPAARREGTHTGARPGVTASPSRTRRRTRAAGRPVFWLPDPPAAEPSQPAHASVLGQWPRSTTVPGYSDGLAPDSHRLPADPAPDADLLANALP